MTAVDRDGASVRIPPPLVYLAALIAGGLVHRYLFALSLDLPRGVRFAAAAVAAAIGFGVMAAAVGSFRRTGQVPAPWKTTPEIVSTGVYRVTRNPMYVGMALLQAAIGIGLLNGWIVLLILPVLAIIQIGAIRHEEAYLERKFADTYHEYRRSVRRWL